MRRAVVAVAIVAGVMGGTAAASAGLAQPEESSADVALAVAAVGPAGGPSYPSAEDAALAAASQRLGSDDGLVAEVVFHFPPPDDNDVRVRVSGDGFCAIWGAYQESLDAGWRANGEGREDLCLSRERSGA